MDYRTLENGSRIPVSKRYLALEMFRNGKSLDEVMLALGLTRVIAVHYCREARLEAPSDRELLSVSVPHLSPEQRGRLADWLQNECVPLFVKSLN